VVKSQAKVVIPLLPACVDVDDGATGRWEVESYIELRPGGPPVYAKVRAFCPLTGAEHWKVVSCTGQAHPFVVSVHQLGAGFAALAELERVCGEMQDRL
jgi:hypothetical protein